ncbi:preprotein translocase subunit SecA [Candidatus Levibacter sp. Uisw_134_01]|uniref:preprotein translocase subunit SecA n=1 Tax=Candidatus Levibacter sp. Uisw_134_01 TaxID=3230999 RepID=UPI003D4B8DFB
MFNNLTSKFFGSSNDRQIKKYNPLVHKINELEDIFIKLSDQELKLKTIDFKEKLSNGETLDNILPEAFATVREAAKRTLSQRHFDVQLIGGLVLHEGKIAEMKTGEGKTLVSTLACYLNALEGKGVHVVTVNDYLAKRDSEWMGQIYNLLGMSVGCILSDKNDEERRIAYKADITYGTNNEFGFDYLRDNMKYSLDEMVQRPFNFAIIDEVDSILIDEARTPLVISGQSEDSSTLYKSIDKFIPLLKQDDFELDEKQRTCNLTDIGINTVEEALRSENMIEDGSLFDIKNVSLLHHINQALRAHKLFQKNTHYMVKDDSVIIIDEFTGRAMEGRRFGEGQHQAIEAKEKITVQPENQTLASVTFQNYFRMYPKLSGMTGTALTEEGEFSEIYNLQVLAVPTNLKVARIDSNDEIYKTNFERDEAVILLIEDCQKNNQPVLVGTVSIEKSEILSNLLKEKNIKHEVLNAKFHEQEAQIIGYAGIPGAVTIATNMAGRGTDIQLGGNLEIRQSNELKSSSPNEGKLNDLKNDIEKKKNIALQAGGLYVIGTERHESRRIDNQLRGRTGRQGDPGGSKFLLSLQDDLMRIFGSDRLENMLGKLGLEKGEAIVHPWINKAVEKAQGKVEAHNFEIRKQLLKFDDVMNDQRKVIFDQRKEIMRSDDISEMVVDMRYEVIEAVVFKSIPNESYHDQWDGDGLIEDVKNYLGLDVPIKKWIKEDGIIEKEIISRLTELSNNFMAERAVKVGVDVFRQAEKTLMLQVLDQSWKDHLLMLDQMRQSIGLRAYAQKDPLNEYKREAFELFEDMLDKLRKTITSVLSNIEIRQENNDENQEINTPLKIDSGKIARNSICPLCDSGKKYKHCCGKL